MDTWTRVTSSLFIIHMECEVDEFVLALKSALKKGLAKDVEGKGLPEGWTMQVDPNGHVFFINHNERKTTFVDPRMVNENDLGPLPEGWEARKFADGEFFFVDHSTHQTQWEDPRISNPTIAGPLQSGKTLKYRYFSCFSILYNYS